MNLLILSIGSNPIPNFVIAKYLLNKDREDISNLPLPDKIMLVFSSDTEKFKNKIIEKLKLENKLIPVNLGADHRNFQKIVEKVSNKLGEKNYTNIHFNYTGGTKVMSLAIYEALRKLDGVDLIYSDLSPDDFKLTIRDGGKFPVNSSLQDIISISIEELFELHCLKPKHLKRKNEFFTQKFTEFLLNKRRKFIKNKESDDFYDSWKNYEGNEKQLLVSIKPYYSNEISDKKIEKLSKFIGGVWLEEYTYSILKEIEEECKLTDIAWDINAFSKSRQFQVDVIAIKGYQSFVFTCTTDDTLPLCKSKAFEGIYRSEQLGGEHSKTILVSFLNNDDSELIKKDMSQFDATKNFNILSLDDVDGKEKFKNNIISILNK